jgi:hypothetical protein
MRKVEAELPVAWVVYRMALQKNPTGGIAICEQAEWDEMERERPGYHTLIREQIASETEAEKLAREQSGSPGTSAGRLKAR